MRKIATITAVKRRKQNFFLGLCISLEIFESFSFWENVTSTTTTTTITTTKRYSVNVYIFMIKTPSQSKFIFTL